MTAPSLEARGFKFYVDRLRQGLVDPYASYRICEKSWNVPLEDAELLRLAVRQVIAADPWFLANSDVSILHVLRATELEALTPIIGGAPAHDVAALLRAKLWFYADGGPHRTDRASRARLRRSLAFLRQVKRPQRDQSWSEMLVGCYRVLDYGKYVPAVAALIRATDPEWRASALRDVLGLAASRKDWATYDRFRRDWDHLPPGYHACECYIHDVSTGDGLRAVAARRWDEVRDTLNRASAVRGCPHLNAGGLRLDLVRLLITKRKHLPAASAYLERAAQFPAGQQEVVVLKQRISSAAIKRE